MKASIKTQWLAALRSGKYQQNHDGKLRINDKYCCLGVLCDVVAPGQWLPREPKHPGRIGTHYVHYIDPADKSAREFSSCELPLKSLMDMVQYSHYPRPCADQTGPIFFDDDHPIWEKLRTLPSLKRASDAIKYWQTHGRIELSALNDAGVSFLEIADIIEEFIPADPESEPETTTATPANL